MGGIGVAWKSFAVSIARVIVVSDVVIVDSDIEQDLAAAPTWAAEAATRSRWVVTDVWAAEDDQGRLVCGHPELMP
jgi:hypothetical protein